MKSKLQESKFTKNFEIKSFESAVPCQVDKPGARFPYGMEHTSAKLIHVNSQLALELGTNEEFIQNSGPLFWASEESPFSFSYNYGGHQFGHWADQLGDGRAIVLGELLGHELQLKGAGLTPFSRRGDGAAVMRSSIREYLASEAMHCLGIATTRALCIASTGEKVLRDRFYDGNANYEAGAIVCRTAPSFLRFGNFQLPAVRGNHDEVEHLVRFVGETYYSQDTSLKIELSALGLLDQVVRRTAEMISAWQCFGFTHGVMNTDNMSILGLTIDYGPFGFLDKFDPNFTPNTSDLPGRRYAFGNQVDIAAWNLTRLAECFLPFASEGQLITVLRTFQDHFDKSWQKRIALRFGFEAVDHQHLSFINDFFSLMQLEKLDYNFILRELAQGLRDGLLDEFYGRMNKFFPAAHQKIQILFDKYLALLDAKNFEKIGSEMCKHNPRFLLKNHTLHRVIESVGKGDFSVLALAFKMVSHPFEDWKEYEDWWGISPDWADTRDVQMNSCSS